MMRLKRFTQEEKAAAQRWSEHCRMQNPVNMAVPAATVAVAPPPAPARTEAPKFPVPFEEVRGG